MTQAWADVVDYLWRLGDGDYEAATDLLDQAIDRDGIGAMNDAFADACRALMDRIVFPAGTVDIHTVVDHIALRICDTARDNTALALDRQRSLLVFLGSEGLPCAARDDVSQWSQEERLRASIACTIGLIGVVMHDEGRTPAEVVHTIEPPEPPVTPEGTFGLAWRGANVAEPFAGVVPHGYTAHITFIGTHECSLRAIFARVAMLRDAPLHANMDLAGAEVQSDAEV
jgi:hypothetical protein